MSDYRVHGVLWRIGARIEWLALWLFGWLLIAAAIAFAALSSGGACAAPAAFAVYMTFHNFTPWRQQKKLDAEIREMLRELGGVR